MKLKVVKMNCDIELDYDIVPNIRFGVVSFLYDMGTSIVESINNYKSSFDKAILSEYDYIRDGISIEEDEKDYYFDKINSLRENLSQDIESFLNSFESIEIDVDDIEDFDKVEKLIEGINIPVIINVREISDSYLINNIKRIDDNLKKKFSNRITYCIKQCMYDSESHYEDNSYDVSDVLLVLNFLDDIVKDVEKYNFTPFEKIMYVYDIVKDRYFKYADEEESYLESRDLARVLKSDKIVCFGFVILFKSILDKLGIENDIVNLNGVTDETIGHVRNLICVKDSKYDLDHILYFDATWDSKKENICDAELLDVDRYDHFAKNKLYFMQKDRNRLKEIHNLPYFLRKNDDYSFLVENVSDNLRDIKRMFSKIDWYTYCKEYIDDEDLFYKMSCLLSDNPSVWFTVIKDSNFCIDAYIECCKMLKREVSSDVFSKCLYTVRKVQNSLNPDKYNNDIDCLIDIISRYNGVDKNLFRIFFGEKTVRDLEEYATINLTEKDPIKILKK